MKILLDLLRVVAGGLVAGIVVALINNRFNRKAREASYLREQLQKLYGPLEFYTTQNDICFKRYNMLSELRGEEYGTRRIEDFERDEHAESIKVGNDYVARAKQGSITILDILRDNYAYVDPDDMEEFTRLVEDYIRMEIEWKPDESKPSGETPRLPFLLLVKSGDVSFMYPSFIRRVHEKFLAKQRELKKLGG